MPPTRDRAALDRAIDNLSTNPGTAIGAAILQSSNAIAEVDPQVEPVGNAALERRIGPFGPERRTGQRGRADERRQWCERQPR